MQQKGTAKVGSHKEFDLTNGRGELCSPEKDRRSPPRVSKILYAEKRNNPDRFSRVCRGYLLDASKSTLFLGCQLKTGLIAIGILLWLAFYNSFRNVGKHEDTVPVIGLDGDLYESVPGVSFHKIGYRCLTRQHVIRENRF